VAQVVWFWGSDDDKVLLFSSIGGCRRSRRNSLVLQSATQRDCVITNIYAVLELPFFYMRVAFVQSNGTKLLLKLPLSKDCENLVGLDCAQLAW
jgi:hypothetical protein